MLSSQLHARDHFCAYSNRKKQEPTSASHSPLAPRDRTFACTTCDRNARTSMSEVPLVIGASKRAKRDELHCIGRAFKLKRWPINNNRISRRSFRRRQAKRLSASASYTRRLMYEALDLGATQHRSCLCCCCCCICFCFCFCCQSSVLTTTTMPFPPRAQVNVYAAAVGRSHTCPCAIVVVVVVVLVIPARRSRAV